MSEFTNKIIFILHDHAYTHYTHVHIYNNYNFKLQHYNYI